MTGENITVAGHVFVEGNLTLVNTSLTVTGRLQNPAPPPPPPVQPESARVYVNGSLTLRHSRLALRYPFDAGPLPAGIDRIPPGLRVGGRASVLFTDLDNSSLTPQDASLLTVVAATSALLPGSYSVFLQGAHFTMRNSAADHLGADGYPGLEFNASTVSIEGSFFNASDNATVMNACDDVWVANTTFDHVGQPLSLRAGARARLTALLITNFTLGIQLDRAAFPQVLNLTAAFGVPQVSFSGWAPQGTLVAVNRSTNLTLSGLTTLGNWSGAVSDALQPLSVNNTAGVAVTSVNIAGAFALGSVSRSFDVSVQGLTARNFSGGLEFQACVRLDLRDLSLLGNAARALAVRGSSDVTVSNFTGASLTGLAAVGSSPLTVDGASVNVTRVGLDISDGSDVTLRGVAVTGRGIGVSLVNVTRALVDRPDLEFSAEGLRVVFSSNVTLTSPSLRSTPGERALSALSMQNVTDVVVTSFFFSGTCRTLGTVDGGQRLTIDGFEGGVCEGGLSLTDVATFTLRTLSLEGAWNGTALGLYGASDGQVVGADLRFAGDFALSLGNSARVTVTSVNGTGAGRGGTFILASRDILVEDADFSASGGTGLSIMNATGPVSVRRALLGGGHLGAEVLGSPGASLEDVDLSSCVGEGLYVDPASPRATLHNLTVVGNGAAGILVGAQGASFIDGNVSSNAGAGIDASPGVRLDWTVAFAASLTLDEARLTGDLVVRPGASFAARSALVRVDEDARQGNADPVTLIEVDGAATFDGVTLVPENASRPYSVNAAAGSWLSIHASSWTGGGSASPYSLVASFDTLLVDNSTFAGWWRPLDAHGTGTRVSDTLFSGNADGPRFDGTEALLLNVTSSLEGADGVVLGPGSSATLVGGLLTQNRAVGLRADSADVTLEGLALSLNFQYGAVLNGSRLTASALRVVQNTVGGLLVSGGPEATLTSLSCDSNTGVGLTFAGTLQVTLTDASVTSGGGTGLWLDGVAGALLAGGTVSFNGAFGLRATGAGTLDVEGTRFDGNGLAHLSLEGTTVTQVVQATFAASPGDAVVLLGSARASIVDAATSGSLGRVFARETGYAYVLNATFAPPSAEAGGQVDVAWNLRVRVLLSSGGPAAGASVEVWNASGSKVADGVADPSGTAGLFPVLEESVFASGRVESFGPHALKAHLQGQGSAAAPAAIDAFTVVTLTLDAAAPTVSLTLDGPAGAPGWFIGPVTVALDARDDRPLGVTLFWREAGGPWRSQAGQGNTTSLVLLYSDEGPVSLAYYAADAAGNTAPSANLTFGIDLTAPVATLEPLPSVIRGANVTLAWNASDGAGSGVADFTLEVSFEGGPFAPWLNATADRSARFEGPDGKYVFRLTARDRAGLSSSPVESATALRFTGTVRLTVVDVSGAALPGARAAVAGLDLNLTGAGDLVFHLPEGNYTLRVSAPGYNERLIPVEVTAGSYVDLGPVALDHPLIETAAPGLDILFLSVLLACVVGATGLLMLLRQSRRRREPR